MIGYWMDEASGTLRPAVEAYLLTDTELSEEHLRLLRAYLRQWISAPVWAGDKITALRESVDFINCRAAVDRWLEAALKANIDPL